MSLSLGVETPCIHGLPLPELSDTSPPFAPSWRDALYSGLYSPPLQAASPRPQTNESPHVQFNEPPRSDVEFHTPPRAIPPPVARRGRPRRRSFSSPPPLEPIPALEDAGNTVTVRPSSTLRAATDQLRVTTRRVREAQGSPPLVAIFPRPLQRANSSTATSSDPAPHTSNEARELRTFLDQRLDTRMQMVNSVVNQSLSRTSPMASNSKSED